MTTASIRGGTASPAARRRGSAGAPGGPAGVVLLHGLARSTGSLWLLARRLEAYGYATARIAYPSRRLGVEQAVDWVAGRLAAATRGWRVVHLVGHSFGGIVARRLAERRPDPRIGRVVQLGAPNRGSRVAGRIRRLPFARRFLGPALDEIPALGPVAEAEGVAAIAGVLPLPRRGLAPPTDGLVTVRSAWDGAARRAALPSLHGWLPLSAEAARQVARFLAEPGWERPA